MRRLLGEATTILLCLLGLAAVFALGCGQPPQSFEELDCSSGIMRAGTEQVPGGQVRFYTWRHDSRALTGVFIPDEPAPAPTPIIISPEVP